MPVRVAMLGVAHVHAPSYVHCLASSPNAELVGHWDKDAALAEAFSRHGSQAWSDRQALIEASDAVVIAGENLDHASLVEVACAAGKSVLCEKPLAASFEELERIERAVGSSGALLMTAFPCPYSPAFESALAKVMAGDVGRVLSVCATNHGKCPGGWFTQPEKSGGGAMVDHTVHVADLLKRVLGEPPVSVHAMTGNKMYGQDWEDTAMLTIEYANGVFASLDASWSRPKSYKTWGDVTLKIVGEKGVIELDLFLQGLETYSDDSGSMRITGFGSDLDRAMIEDFLKAHQEGSTPRATMQDGLDASRIALAGYESAKTGQPVKLSEVSTAR